ncbi:MAG: Appr-p processing domain protein [Hydrocarboniphaga sp.]|uniref:type II toxin-antitoxin system antitoxin DNA ADP-ribosyl glycohydrolase DarG n=1 Tax=Hydrocarboniphaga sp. TaxID=2033016 RepID=UPI00260D3A55|nr:macro domain-containing protein [Hydrocarboniphaga sp.]MDB5972085.1 Appr-p processing domain protein [Hydrocarboniphaga sp.]
MIKLTQGDLLKQDDVDAIVNTVNRVGVMGKGIALQFKNKWPANFAQYVAACKAGEVRPGRMFVHDSGGLVKPNYIINFPTKDHWRGASKIEFIRDGLVDLVAQVQRLGIHSIAIPPLGCGNGGLDWADVRPLIETAFAPLTGVEVRLFEPGGAPPPKTMEVRTKPPRMTSGRAAIVKVLDTYRALNYGLSKIEVQKLAYFLQEAGEPLKLPFVKHHYGPYSDTLRHALNTMEGHFIRGLGDGVVEAEIEPTENALAEAEAFIARQEHAELAKHVARVASLIDGFQSSYGMELLASVHWVATHEPGTRSVQDAVASIHAWNARKKALMKPEHIASAWNRLDAEGWFLAR